MKAGYMEQVVGPDPTDYLGDCCNPEPGTVDTLKWVRGKEQSQQRHKLKDLPGLFRQGLSFRRRSTGAALSEALSDPVLGNSPRKAYSENIFCAGKVLRDTFLSQASHLIKELRSSATCRKMCAGSEMVDWLVENCPFLQSRVKATGVWQILLEMGILSPVERRHLYFQDTSVLFQFSAEGCDHPVCSFGTQEWQKGVQLLLQLAPQVPSRRSACSLPALKVIEDKVEVNEETLQIQALAHLTAAVQKELAAVLAVKAGKHYEPQEEENSTKAELQSSRDIIKETVVSNKNCCSLSPETVLKSDRLESTVTSKNYSSSPETTLKSVRRMISREIDEGRFMPPYRLQSLPRKCHTNVEHQKESPVIQEKSSAATFVTTVEPVKRMESMLIRANCCSPSSENTMEPVKSMANLFCTLQEGEDIQRIELVRRLARESCQFLQASRKGSQTSAQQNDKVPTLQEKEENKDVLVLQNVLPESPAPSAGSANCDWRYMVVSGTPEKILEHLLNDLHQVEGQGKETDSLLDDFLLTYTVFMSTGDLCQALLRHYCTKRYGDKEDESDALFRKQKVLQLVSQWTTLYRDWLREDEHTKLFLKTLYRYILDDLYEYPSLEKELKEFQKLLRMHRRQWLSGILHCSEKPYLKTSHEDDHTVDEYSPHRKNKTLFHQFSLRESWLQHKGAITEEGEVFCHIYITDHSYLSMKVKLSTLVQEVLKMVAEKLQYLDEELALVAVEFSGEKRLLQPNDCFISKSMVESSRVFVCRQDLTDVLNLFADSEETLYRTVRMLGINAWDLAAGLTDFDWTLFNAIHEQDLICYIFSSQSSGGKTANLNLLLQRCNEVQLWVATEILLCNQLCKRVQMVKKFIKAAAHCKAQRNLNSFFAIIMGLNTAAVGRLSQTWEKIPGKFRKLYSELESLTDPSLNHKAYRDAFKKMKPPKIPFVPLLIKDVTFIHEGNKTFLDNLVNFEKLHMIADTVRLIRHCRSDQMRIESTSKEQQDVKMYIQHLHIIDSQQIMFELSHRLEPRV
ncbi:rap guanine nucleotide exchange factor 5 isoform X2 [Protopterus annectens]|uniref:rap guanine nucleotide exchange factor 5 isoform X2 n=1 Tax=Protopterus annectens TaxID=7888 RepID=UPI001CFB72B0|nr:rap guanine nucleotide exchange factor 5 isoform X2 [Protopterus annectens]